MKHTDSFEIIPGERVGKFLLGMGFEELTNLLDFEYKIDRDQNKDIFIHSDCFIFHFIDDNRLNCINVFGEFYGKYNNLIGIGSILSLEKEIIDYEIDQEFLDQTMWWRFRPLQTRGIHFITEKEWDDKTPIQIISVFLDD